jgi:hypothetical protein
MSSRNFGIIAIGRFLVVERYRETCVSPSTERLRAPGPDRSGGRADSSGSRSGSRAPARPQHG